jgi:hypothetical protein
MYNAQHHGRHVFRRPVNADVNRCHNFECVTILMNKNEFYYKAKFKYLTVCYYKCLVFFFRREMNYYL